MLDNDVDVEGDNEFYNSQANLINADEEDWSIA